MRAIVTGAAGFVGSALVDRLLAKGYFVAGVDNFVTGRNNFLSGAYSNSKFKLFEIDCLDLDSLKKVFTGGDIVFHLAANADVRFGTSRPRIDLEQNTIATHNVLEAMRENNLKKIVFSSTGSVYGEAPIIPTPENCPFPIQTSLYGASKAACEGLISAYSEGFGFQSWIFRFVSILGERYTHGHVFDFLRSLRRDPSFLEVLGNGQQRKSYLYVQDCISAMLLALEKSSEKVNIFNLGVNDYCKVEDSVHWICRELEVEPTIKYSGGDRGWVGDNPFIFLDTGKIESIGWRPETSIRDGVIKTVRYLLTNEWVFEDQN